MKAIKPGRRYDSILQFAMSVITSIGRMLPIPHTLSLPHSTNIIACLPPLLHLFLQKSGWYPTHSAMQLVTTRR